MRTALVRLLGWRSLPFHGDPTLHDRWRWVRRHLPGGRARVLDAGSGTGNIATCTAKLGHEVLGLSNNEEWNALARERAAIVGADGLRIQSFDLRELRTRGGELGRFDVVVCCELIEHVREDAALVADLASVLAPGGRLLLTTPSADHPPLVDEHLDDRDEGGHVRFGYAEADLRRIVEAAGLRVVEVDGVSGLVSRQLTNLMRVLKRRSYALAWAGTLPLRAVQPLDRPLTRLAGRPWLSIAVVAERPASAG
jgi:2-polyprenyl-3-methyl-5-hydroxy-6-metoxy-1,4-benzoquinol methylase